MIYKNEKFVEPYEGAIGDVINAYPFATVVIQSKDGIEAGHFPFVYERNEGEKGTLYVHFARANPIRKAFDSACDCRVIFNGPQSYISPSWYPMDADDHLPTWNYVVVHAFGNPQRIDSAAKILWQMREIFQRHDRGEELDISEEEKRLLIPQVVLYSIPIDRFESIFKLNQNRAVEDAAGAAEGLQRTGDPQKKELSLFMAKAIESRKP